MATKDIKVWQKALQDRGLYSGKIDGDFGPGTSRASFEAINEVSPVPTASHETRFPAPVTVTSGLVPLPSYSAEEAQL